MKEVDAVKSEEMIVSVEEEMRQLGKDDVADLWRIGINFALRVGDLLSLRFSDVEGESLVVKESKTSKERVIKISKTARKYIDSRRETYPDDEFLFQSHGNRVAGMVKPFSQPFVNRVFTEVGRTLGIRLGTHSMRKTKGYMMYSAGVDITVISMILNHSSEAVTRRYIGITAEELANVYDEFDV